MQARRAAPGAVYKAGHDPRDRPMNSSSKMSRDEVLRVRLELLQREHRDLDEAIAALHGEGKVDALTLRRLKKRKLHLKDAIQRVSDDLTPDIIA